MLLGNVNNTLPLQTFYSPPLRVSHHTLVVLPKSCQSCPSPHPPQPQSSQDSSLILHSSALRPHGTHHCMGSTLCNYLHTDTPNALISSSHSFQALNCSPTAPLALSPALYTDYTSSLLNQTLSAWNPTSHLKFITNSGGDVLLPSNPALLPQDIFFSFPKRNVSKHLLIFNISHISVPWSLLMTLTHS